jgi:uncharacterized membrane protein
MKLVGRIALGVLAVLVVLALVGALRSRQWHVEQSVIINAPPARIHPFIEDLRKWPEWTVWNKGLDPKVVWTWEGPDRGVGARWAWNGPVMGKGRLEIVESDPEKGVRVDEAIESEVVNAHGHLAYSAAGGGTKVTWVDEGVLPAIVGSYFRGMIEQMLNDNLAQGLAKLKATVEALPPPKPPRPAPAPTAGEEAGTPDVDAGPAPAP